MTEGKRPGASQRPTAVFPRRCMSTTDGGRQSTVFGVVSEAEPGQGAPMIRLNIDVTKIPKDRIQSNPKWKGKFINCILVDHPNDKGDDGFIAMDRTKEEREAKAKSVVIGNWKHLGGQPKAAAPAPRPTSQPPSSRPAPDPALEPEEDDIPF